MTGARGPPRPTSFSADGLLTVPADLAPATEPAEIDTTRDLALTWSGEGDSGVVLSLVGSAGEVTCGFDDDGSGVVPAELLGRLGPGSATGSVERIGAGAFTALDPRTDVAAIAAVAVGWSAVLR